MTEVHVLVPDGIDDPCRPSGGNVYDRRVCDGLVALGWSVHEYAVAGQWPLPDAEARLAVGAALARVQDGEVVLVDGLVASVVPEVLEPEADRLRLVVLLHMPRDEASEVAALSAASAIVATSNWTRRWLIDHYAVPEDRVYVVPPGVDVARLAPGSLSGGRLLCVGSITPAKGHDLVLEALAPVNDPGVAVRLRRLTEPRCEVRRRTTQTGRGLGPGRPGVLHRPAEGRRTRARLRRGGRLGTGLPSRDLRHGRHRGARPRAACRVHEGRRRAGGSRPRRLTLSDWGQTSRELSAVLTEVAG